MLFLMRIRDLFGCEKIRVSIKRNGSLLISGIFLTLVASACSIKVTPKKKTGSLNSIGASEATLSFHGLLPHQYQMEVRWPKAYQAVEVQVNGEIWFRQTQNDTGSFVAALEERTNYHVIVSGMKEGHSNLQELGQWSFVSPHDEVLNPDFLKSQKEKNTAIEIFANRVFIAPGKEQQPSLITWGKSLVINTNELITRDSYILTFPSGQQGEAGQVGRSGGSIIIKARSAQGQLHVVMRGEMGGDGRIGEPYSERAAAGSPGQDGVNCRRLPRSPGSFTSLRCTCEVYPNSGGTGASGAPGRPGGNGMRGGDSGKLHIEIAEQSPNWEFSVVKEPGKAGLPAKGGAGQRGGVGGVPGKLPGGLSCFLLRLKVGQEGSTGLPGADGVQESDGTIEQECVSIGQGFGRCST